jgi:hypothetical protein
MIKWRIGIVTDCVPERSGLQEVRVKLGDGSIEPALHDTTVHEALKPGDVVLLNTTAVYLKLGTGGYHFVHAVFPRVDAQENGDVPVPALDRYVQGMPLKAESDEENVGRGFVARDNTDGRSPADSPRPNEGKRTGHMMKLKYTSLQRAVLAAEEENSPYHELFLRHRSIDGVPVLIGELHSMLPVAAAWLRRRDAKLRVAYVMTDGGALPISFSRHVTALKQLSWLCGTVTYGQAYGGDLETMNKFTALIAARHILQADVIIVCMGPGIAGTGTPLGHTGTEAGELVNAVDRLGGTPIMIPRVSGADRRSRHYGVSHHLLVNLDIVAACPAVLPMNRHLPDAVKSVSEQQLAHIGRSGFHRIEWLDTPAPPELESALRTYPLKISTMGRTWSDDPAFYLCVASAAEYALKMVRR